MKKDDSFKKPGSIPFKWEIRPGVPKLQPTQTHSGRSKSEKQQQRKQEQPPIPVASINHNHPFPETPRKLKPPPAGLYFRPQMEPRTRNHSARSSPCALSDRFARPDVVSTAGCFPSPLGKLKNGKKRDGYPRSIPEPDYYSDLDITTRCSVSSRKSISPLSPYMYIPSRHSSPSPSPRPVYDSIWAGFGLF